MLKELQDMWFMVAAIVLVLFPLGWRFARMMRRRRMRSYQNMQKRQAGELTDGK